MKARATITAILLAGALGHMAAGPATVRAETSEEPALEEFGPGPIDRFDPIERWNRGVYRFNAGIDKYVFLPALHGYRLVVPKPLRVGFSNVLSNLDQITSLTNSVLQLDMKKSAGTLARFLVNTTLGCAGLADPAAYLGLIDYEEDFGQTLGSWGVGAGPYLVLPLAGPSSLRDGIGMGVDIGFRSYLQSQIVDVSLLDPGYVAWAVGQALDARDEQPFRYGEAGPFEYDLVRYLYLEMRKAEIAF
jgi:phospholipid-binding lipoprotein MlaA